MDYESRYFWEPTEQETSPRVTELIHQAWVIQDKIIGEALNRIYNSDNMNQTEYLQQNAKGYEGDEFIGKEVAKLVEQFGVNQIIETGTFRGATTKRLAEFAPVFTVEIDPQNYRFATQEFMNIKKHGNNITFANGNSVDYLKKWLPSFSDKSLLCFLDAHWNDYCPLKDELKVIAHNQLKPVIVIHDWKVPGRPDLGYDSYQGQDYTYEWIEPELIAIYGKDGYNYHFNEVAAGASRGVIYIYPKKDL